MVDEIKKAVIGGKHGYHHIIYTDNTLKDVVSDIIKENTSDNLILYIDDFGLPNDSVNIDEKTKELLASEYLYLSIYEKALESIDLNTDVSRLEYMIKNPDEVKIAKDIKDLVTKSKKIVKDIYYSKGPKYSDLPISIFPLTVFDMEDLVELCNKGRITVVLDNIEDISIFSKYSVNDLIGSRITKYLTCILSTSREKWDCYFTSNGHLIQEVHDYLEINYREKTLEKERYYGK